jgi:hypothetical protein
MTRLRNYLVAIAAAGFTAPVLAQYPAPYPQQPYPPQYGQGYQQGYAGNPVQQIVDQLLGNRYNVNDRTAVQRCASAVVAQASGQYRGPGYGQPAYNQYGQPGYGQQRYGTGARVTAITNVEQRRSGLRVSGLLDTRGGMMPPYGQAYGYQNQGYAATGDLSFRCTVDYRGAVSDIRIRQNNPYRGR